MAAAVWGGGKYGGEKKVEVRNVGLVTQRTTNRVTVCLLLCAPQTRGTSGGTIVGLCATRTAQHKALSC